MPQSHGRSTKMICLPIWVNRLAAWARSYGEEEPTELGARHEGSRFLDLDDEPIEVGRKAQGEDSTEIELPDRTISHSAGERWVAPRQDL